MFIIGLIIITVFSVWLNCFIIGLALGLAEECLQDRYKH